MREWVTAVVKIGAPSALLIFVIIWLTGDFNLRLHAIENQHANMISHAERTEDLMGRAYMSSERILWVLRMQCVNAAKTPDARRLCLTEEPTK